MSGLSEGKFYSQKATQMNWVIKNSSRPRRELKFKFCVDERLQFVLNAILVSHAQSNLCTQCLDDLSFSFVSEQKFSREWTLN